MMENGLKAGCMMEITQVIGRTGLWHDGKYIIITLIENVGMMENGQPVIFIMSIDMMGTGLKMLAWLYDEKIVSRLT